MTFVDLFAGLGGFHVALSRLGHECVFACELNAGLRAVYEKNFSITPKGDITSLKASTIPPHDILCAGFPCQPFSKAGGQLGLKCPRWGGLFDHVLRVIRKHHPSYLIFENVPNLERHDGGATWAWMARSLQAEGYTIEDQRLSPHQFGIPQIRDRIYIVGSRFGLDGFAWPSPQGSGHTDVRKALSKKPKDARPLCDDVKRCLAAWQDFITKYPKREELPSFPIWSMEFGATYPFEDETPYAMGWRRLKAFQGSHGRPLELPREEQFASLPSHARNKTETFPDWKRKFIRRNREIYARNRSWIDRWLPSILPFPSSYQKLEWNCKGDERDLWSHIVQFRASGVRIKKPTSSPSLVAMSTSQVPIIPWESRYMTPRECARLQCLSVLKYLPEIDRDAFMALGNAVNVDVVRAIAANLLQSARSSPRGNHKSSVSVKQKNSA